jgi:hypothetical protein
MLLVLVLSQETAAEKNGPTLKFNKDEFGPSQSSVQHCKL